MSRNAILSAGRDRPLLFTRNRVLEEAGYIVTATSTASETVERFFGGDFDLFDDAEFLAPNRGRIQTKSKQTFEFLERWFWRRRKVARTPPPVPECQLTHRGPPGPPGENKMKRGRALGLVCCNLLPVVLTPQRDGSAALVQWAKQNAHPTATGAGPRAAIRGPCGAWWAEPASSAWARASTESIPSIWAGSPARVGCAAGWTSRCSSRSRASLPNPTSSRAGTGSFSSSGSPRRS